MNRPVVVAALVVLAAPSVLAHAAERGEAKATVAGKAVAIDYGRPLLRGRDMLAQAEVGRAWRMGADAATTLKSDADLSFGGKAVPKGSYVLTATKLAEDQWQLNVATNDTEKKAVAAVPLTTLKLAESVEQFTIDIKGEKDGGELLLSWGTMGLKTVFTAR